MLIMPNHKNNVSKQEKKMQAHDINYLTTYQTKLIKNP